MFLEKARNFTPEKAAEECKHTVHGLIVERLTFYETGRGHKVKPALQDVARSDREAAAKAVVELSESLL